MNKKTVKVQIYKEVWERNKWLDVSELLSEDQAVQRIKHHQSQYPHNLYRLVYL